MAKVTVQQRLENLQKARQNNLRQLEVCQQQEWAYQGAIALLRDMINEEATAESEDEDESTKETE